MLHFRPIQTFFQFLSLPYVLNRVGYRNSILCVFSMFDSIGGSLALSSTVFWHSKAVWFRSQPDNSVFQSSVVAVEVKLHPQCWFSDASIGKTLLAQVTKWMFNLKVWICEYVFVCMSLSVSLCAYAFVCKCLRLCISVSASGHIILGYVNICSITWDLGHNTSSAVLSESLSNHITLSIYSLLNPASIWPSLYFNFIKLINWVTMSWVASAIHKI